MCHLYIFLFVSPVLITKPAIIFVMHLPLRHCLSVDLNRIEEICRGKRYTNSNKHGIRWITAKYNATHFLAHNRILRRRYSCFVSFVNGFICKYCLNSCIICCQWCLFLLERVRKAGKAHTHSFIHLIMAALVQFKMRHVFEIFLLLSVAIHIHKVDWFKRHLHFSQRVRGFARRSFVSSNRWDFYTHTNNRIIIIYIHCGAFFVF